MLKEQKRKDAVKRPIPTNHIIAHDPADVKCNFLRSLRVQKKTIVKDVQEIYPKYNRSIHAKCVSGEYGIEIKDDVYDFLTDRYSVKKSDGHTLKKRVACRVSDERYDELMRYIKDDGYETVQAWLDDMVEQYMKQKREA